MARGHPRIRKLGITGGCATCVDKLLGAAYLAYAVERAELSPMIFQLVDAEDERFRWWTGTAETAIRRQADLGQLGRTVSVNDYKGRRLSASDLYECAAKENERYAVASLAAFKQLMEARDA